MRKINSPVAGPKPAMLRVAREAACAVADAALEVVTSGRWMPTKQCSQAYTLSMNILELEASLGAVCEARYAVSIVAKMAENAHQIIGYARYDASMNDAMLSRTTDWQLIDGCMEDALVPAYTIVAIAA